MTTGIPSLFSHTARGAGLLPPLRLLRRPRVNYRNHTLVSPKTTPGSPLVRLVLAVLESSALRIALTQYRVVGDAQLFAQT